MKLCEILVPVSNLSGVGPNTAALFAKLNIFTVADLLSTFPREYDDRTQRLPLCDFQKGKVHTIAEVVAHEWFGYGRMKTLKIIINDINILKRIVIKFIFVGKIIIFFLLLLIKIF